VREIAECRRTGEEGDATFAATTPAISPPRRYRVAHRCARLYRPAAAAQICLLERDDAAPVSAAPVPLRCRRVRAHHQHIAVRVTLRVAVGSGRVGANPKPRPGESPAHTRLSRPCEAHEGLVVEAAGKNGESTSFQAADIVAQTRPNDFGSPQPSRHTVQPAWRADSAYSAATSRLMVTKAFGSSEPAPISRVVGGILTSARQDARHWPAKRRPRCRREIRIGPIVEAEPLGRDRSMRPPLAVRRPSFAVSGARLAARGPPLPVREFTARSSGVVRAGTAVTSGCGWPVSYVLTK